MKHRAIKDLSQLNDENLISSISIGLGKIYDNSIELWVSASHLFQTKNYRGYRVLEAFAREEASKYLILLDALRCPSSERSLFTSQLQKFNEHLVKGIYSKACDWRPDSYKCLLEYVRSELDQFYLDGPNGIEWIFRNSIISDREECLYVDYVAYDSSTHDWITPKSKDSYDDLFPLIIEPGVIQIVKALHSAGIAQEKTLKVFSEFWRKFDFDDSTHHIDFRNANFESLKLLEQAHLLGDISGNDFSLILDLYPYPLYREEMKEISVSKESLKKKQENWMPDW